MIVICLAILKRPLSRNWDKPIYLNGCGSRARHLFREIEVETPAENSKELPNGGSRPVTTRSFR